MFVIQKSTIYGKFHIHRTKKCQGNIFSIHPFHITIHRLINQFINSINNLNTFQVSQRPCYWILKDEEEDTCPQDGFILGVFSRFYSICHNGNSSYFSVTG